MNTKYEGVDLDLESLDRISNLINSTLDLPSLLEAIMDTAKEFLHAEASSLLLIDDTEKFLNFYVVSGNKKEIIKEISVPIGTGIAGLVAETGEPILVRDAQNDPRIFKEVDQKTNNITKNLMCVPMKVKNKLVGVLEAINILSETYLNEKYINTLSYLADQAAIAINNTDLYHQLTKTRHTLQHRVKELSILYEFNDLVNFSISLDELSPLCLNFIHKEFSAKASFLYLFNPTTKIFSLSYYYGVQNLPNSIKQFPLTKSMEICFQNELTPIQLENPLPQQFSFLNNISLSQPIIMSPLFTEDNIFGILIICGAGDDKSIFSFNLRLLGNLSNNLSQAYVNLKLHESVIAQNQIKQELKVAYLIQQKILPTTFITPQNIQIQGINIPAEEVGGDFYDYIPIDEHKFALVIADVSGKGIPASLFMALARNTIRTEANHDPNPKKVITTTNERLISDSESGMFVTSAYFLVDIFNHAITYVSAGHNNQLLYRNKSHKVDIIKGFGKPLGVLEGTYFEEKVVFYDPGDILILYTDGITEAEKINGEQFEEERTIEFFKNNHHLPPDELIKEFKEEVERFTEGNPFIDDFTLLITRL